MKPLSKKVRQKRPASGASYAVGYGRPPKATRFRMGQSGNPAGRPKGTKNSATIAKSALERVVTVTESGRRRRMSVRELACRRLADKALSGDIKSLQFLL